MKMELMKLIEGSRRNWEREEETVVCRKGVGEATRLQTARTSEENLRRQ